MHPQLLFSSFFPFPFPPTCLYSTRKLAYIIFKAPGLYFLISSIAFIYVHPLWTRAKATSKGALPRPATQWTPILGGAFLPVSSPSFLIFFLLLGSLSKDLDYFSFSRPDSSSFFSWGNSLSKKLSTSLVHF